MAKILIVEDNINADEANIFRKQVMKSYLYMTERGFGVFSQNTVDLMVLNIMLSTMSGLALLYGVRKTSQIPVIILTALRTNIHRYRALIVWQRIKLMFNR